MRISGKKILAIALSVAMLVSCMVFSFSADASSAIVHTNDYDTVTDTNWASGLPASPTAKNNDYRSTESGLASHDATAGIGGSGAIKLQVNGAYASGFRVFADTESGNGKFTIGVGKWAVNFAYKVNNVSGPVDLYVAVGGFAWSADFTVAGNKLPDGACLKKVASFKAGDVTDWVYRGVDFDDTGIIQGLHFFLVSPDTKAPVAAEVVIDEIEAVQYGSSDTKYPVSYAYNGSVVGTSVPGPALAYANVPELDIDIPAGYKLELYSDAALENKINIARHGTEPTLVYVGFVKDDACALVHTETYDSYTPEFTDGFFKDSNGGDGHIQGNGSGRWLTNKFADTLGTTLAMDQTPKDTNNTAVSALKGVGSQKDFILTPGNEYKVTFRAYSEDGGVGIFSLRDNGVLSYNNHSTNKVSVDMPAKEWVDVTVSIKATSANKLTLLASYNDYEAINDLYIYVDNVTIYEYAAVKAAETDPLAQGFESFGHGHSLQDALHNGNGNVQVTRSVKRTGNQSVWLQTANNGGARRIQFNLPNPNGGYFVAEKGKTYKVTFWLYLKSDGSAEENPTNQANIWLAAADADYVYADGADVISHSLYNPGNVKYFKGVWNKVTFYTTDPESEAYNGGVMRLGISGPTATRYTFWIDDLQVEEVADLNGNAWSFETEALDTDVDAKKSSGRTAVSDKYAYTGNQSLYVYNGTNNGRGRNQIYLKDGNGNDVTVEAGKAYIVTFYAMATAESAKPVYLNMWFATGDGTATRPSSGNGDIAMFYDDGSASTVGLTALENKDKWVKVTRYLGVLPETATGNAVGGKLLMGISDPSSGDVGGHWYLDDVSVTCVDDIEITTPDREQYLYASEVGGVKTNLHKHTTKPNDNGVYTSIRLGAKYRSDKADGSTMIIDGQAYEIVERGIVVGTADMSLDPNGAQGTDYKWKSVKAANNGFSTNWAQRSVAIADADDHYEVEFTLRLANMNKAWFESDTEYVYRSYYTLKIPYYNKGSASVRELTVTVDGQTSDAFTFADLVGDFELDGWFSEVEAAE